MRRSDLVWSATVALALATGGWLLWTHLHRGLVAPHALRPDDAVVTAQGAALYRQHCAACHGAALEGQPNWRIRNADGLLPAPPHDASGHTWHHADDVLVRLTRDGIAATIGDPAYRSAMPAYGGVLRDEEIVAILSWVKSQWPADVRARHDQINRQARAERR